jgi:putative thioredoxin
MPAIDVSDDSFDALVIDESNRRPVVVDFWAPWCEPCKILGPTLEHVAAQRGQAVRLAKLNTDENPETAAKFEIEAIPEVKAFKDGEVVGQFTGVLPEENIFQFFSELAPTDAELVIREAETFADSGDFKAAESAFRKALQENPNNVEALLGLAAILLDKNEKEEAEQCIKRALPDRRAKVMQHEIFFHEFALKHEGKELDKEILEEPNSPRAHYRWGVMLAADGQLLESLDELLISVSIDRNFSDEAARKAILAVFDILGLETQIVREYQRKLGALLF